MSGAAAAVGRAVQREEQLTYVEPLGALGVPVGDQRRGTADDDAAGQGHPAQLLVPAVEQGPQQGDALQRLAQPHFQRKNAAAGALCVLLLWCVLLLFNTPFKTFHLKGFTL